MNRLNALPREVIRATEAEKEAQIATVENLKKAYAEEGQKAIHDLQQAAIRNENMVRVLDGSHEVLLTGAAHRSDVRGGGAVSEEYVG